MALAWILLSFKLKLLYFIIAEPVLLIGPVDWGISRIYHKYAKMANFGDFSMRQIGTIAHRLQQKLNESPQPILNKTFNILLSLKLSKTNVPSVHVLLRLRVSEFRSEYMSVLNFDTRIDFRFAKHTPQGNLTNSLKLKHYKLLHI